MKATVLGRKAFTGKDGRKYVVAYVVHKDGQVDGQMTSEVFVQNFFAYEDIPVGTHLNLEFNARGQLGDAERIAKVG